MSPVLTGDGAAVVPTNSDIGEIVMKRFHIHIVVEDIQKTIEFYSKLFGREPAKQRDDYAKWMLDDPRVNFAISARGHKAGINHLGIQVDTPEELAHIKALADEASDTGVLDQGEVACCYAKSDKHWTLDPGGLAWEHFYTMTDSDLFGEDTATQDGACCIPLRGSEKGDSASCCVPKDAYDSAGACCG